MRMDVAFYPRVSTETLKLWFHPPTDFATGQTGRTLKSFAMD